MKAISALLLIGAISGPVERHAERSPCSFTPARPVLPIPGESPQIRERRLTKNVA